MIFVIIFKNSIQDTPYSSLEMVFPSTTLWPGSFLRTNPVTEHRKVGENKVV